MESDSQWHFQSLNYNLNFFIESLSRNNVSSPEPKTEELTPEEIRVERAAIIEKQIQAERGAKFEELQTLKNLKKRCEDNIKGEPEIAKAKIEVAELIEVIHDTVTKLEHYESEKIKYERIISGEPGIEDAKVALKNANTRIAELEKELK